MECLNTLLFLPLLFDLIQLFPTDELLLIEANHCLFALESGVVLMGEGNLSVEIALNDDSVALPL